MSPSRHPGQSRGRYPSERRFVANSATYPAAGAQTVTPGRKRSFAIMGSGPVGVFLDQADRELLALLILIGGGPRVQVDAVPAHIVSLVTLAAGQCWPGGTTPRSPPIPGGPIPPDPPWAQDEPVGGGRGQRGGDAEFE